MPKLIIDKPTGAPLARFLFAHGAGAPMDSDFMQAISAGLRAGGVEVVRFEFPYMAARRAGGPRRPPDKLELLLDHYRQRIEQFADGSAPLFIGGKSLGGRVASMLARESREWGRVAGLVCLGYPFHPRGRPEKLRTAHLADLDCAALFVQGSRDPLGNYDEVISYGLPDGIRIHWLEDGDHDFTPRRASGHTREEHWHAAVEAALGFINRRVRES